MGIYRRHGGGGEGGETKSGTEKPCFHNLQSSGHSAWWSADNCSIFPTVIIQANIFI